MWSQLLKRLTQNHLNLGVECCNEQRLRHNTPAWAAKRATVLKIKVIKCNHPCKSLSPAVPRFRTQGKPCSLTPAGGWGWRPRVASRSSLSTVHGKASSREQLCMRARRGRPKQLRRPRRKVRRLATRGPQDICAREKPWQPPLLPQTLDGPRPARQVCSEPRD